MVWILRKRYDDRGETQDMQEGGSPLITTKAVCPPSFMEQRTKSQSVVYAWWILPVPGERGFAEHHWLVLHCGAVQGSSIILS
ncbi:hypothetical protein E2C01_081547 [Portunus trituberculatus]|uniref:Uncharacterized protein n=1 Tax=Portunus trituberculatus TaxID=210409 RepID=A0A5B7IMJ3_PORTR|nr:hypothetical protein [Portunus trituberculatus]